LIKTADLIFFSMMSLKLALPKTAKMLTSLDFTFHAWIPVLDETFTSNSR